MAQYRRGETEHSRRFPRRGMKTMRTYTVHELSGAPADGKGIVFVREGFSWPAAVFTLLWLLAKRLWIAAAFWFALSVALMFAGIGLGVREELMSVIYFVLQGCLAVVAHDIERWTLAQKGYVEIGVASGRDLADAERDFFRHWTGPVAATNPEPARPLTAPVWPRREEPDAHGAIGLFPHAGG
jgi:hypothetical protein